MEQPADHLAGTEPIRFQRVGGHGDVGVGSDSVATAMAIPLGSNRCAHGWTGGWRRFPRTLYCCFKRAESERVCGLLAPLPGGSGSQFPAGKAVLDGMAAV